VRFLPFERSTLRSEAPPEVVEARLAGIMVDWRSWPSTPPEPLRGAMTGGTFKAIRVLEGYRSSSFRAPAAPGTWTRNAWDVVVVGNIQAVPAGTEVQVLLRLHGLVAVFTVCWFGGLLYGSGRSLWLGVTDGFGPHFRDGQAVAGEGVGLAVMVAMMLVVYLGMTIAFWDGAKKVKALLCERLGCHQVPSGDHLSRR
jgi:hypothetical protein